MVALGTASWLAVNGLFAEIPALATSAPEGYKIATIMSLALQAANIAPILYALKPRTRKTCERSILVSLLCGACAAALMSKYWGVEINGRHSAVLIGGVRMLSLN